MATDLSRRPPRVVFVDGHRRREFYGGLIAALEKDLHAECTAASPPELLADGFVADLVVVNDESWPFCGAAIPGLRRRGIPTLHLADGILEWRNTWENPARAAPDGLPLFQPVLADKVACLGRAQARILEYWGNTGKCEITGAPRFDGLAKRPEGAPRRPGPPRILIATARTPGFTPEQIELVRTSLHDLATWFSRAGSAFQPIWRIAPEVAEAAEQSSTWGSAPLWEQLDDADALITTPSTVQLEAMKFGIPVALLDYPNRPAFVPAAWTISAAAHFDDVIPSLGDPSPERLSHQEMILDDNLEWRTPATPRVVRLAAAMVEAGRRSRDEGAALRLPDRLLATPEPAVRSHLISELHPDQPVFSESDVAALQAEVGHLRQALRLSWTQTVYRALCRLERRWLGGAKREGP